MTNPTLWTWADLHPVPPCRCGAPTLPRPFQCVHAYIAWRRQWHD